MRKNNSSGFTIVELLIVIVVIAILAAISIVAYTGMQQRARDTKRLNDIKQIQQSIEAYRAIHGSYPSHALVTDSNNTCGSTHTNGYSYSTSTNGRWMYSLISSEIVSSVPTAPGNDCTSFYRYLRPSATSYGCASRTNAYAVLQVYGVEGMDRPDGTVSSMWYPCVGATAGWGPSASVWTFVFEE